MTDRGNCMDRGRSKCMDSMDRGSCMVDWGNCMMEWSSRMVNCCNVMVNCMVGSRCNMEGSGVVGDCHGMDGCGMVEGSCMVGNCVVGNWGSVVGNSMVDRGSVVSHGMVDRSDGMVSNSMVRSGVVNNPVVRVSVSHHWDGVAVLVQDGLGQVRVEQGVGVEAVEGDGCAAVDCVPELTPGISQYRQTWMFISSSHFHLNKC